MLGTLLSILLIVFSGVANLGASARATRAQIEGATSRLFTPAATPAPARRGTRPASSVEPVLQARHLGDETQTCVPVPAPAPFAGPRLPIAPIAPLLPAPPRAEDAPGIEIALVDPPRPAPQPRAPVMASAPRPTRVPQREPGQEQPVALSREELLFEAPGMRVDVLDPPRRDVAAAPPEPQTRPLAAAPPLPARRSPNIWPSHPLAAEPVPVRDREPAAPVALERGAEAVERGAPAAPAHEAPRERSEPAPVAWTERVGYPVTHFRARYAEQYPDAPALAELLQLEVELGRTSSGYVEPGAGDADVRFSLSYVPDGHPKVFYPGALRSINSQIAAEFNRRGLLGVFVNPDERDIDPDTVRDLRDPMRSELGLVIELARVRELRSVGSGDRVATSNRVNNDLHERLRRQSPVQPGSGRAGTDLVRSDLLDDYLFRVNRHPGRRVDVALARSDEGGVAVDYLVSESKPWTAYMQTANNGSDSTGEWRQHFGFVHHQLTGKDDTLQLDYVTSGFDELHSFSGSYDAPLGESQRLRWGLSGQFGSFDASDIRFLGADFSSDTRRLGADLSFNVFQKRELFVDLLGGIGLENLETEHVLLGQKGKGSFLLPHAGARVQRDTPYSRLSASALLEHGMGQNDIEEIVRLGRTFPDKDWNLMRWDGRFSFFVEPLLARTIWNGAPPTASLAHELELGFRGQHAFDSRLVPQHQMVAGGFHSVRGYAEGATAGDSVAIGQLQYNFHVPRSFGANFKPQNLPLVGSFRWAPSQPFSRPDWDLSLHAFVDAARVEQSNKPAFEKDHFLAGAGVGAELTVKRYLSLRFDYGLALRDVDGLADDGDSRVHAAITWRY